jgi:hypothetical protein
MRADGQPPLPFSAGPAGFADDETLAATIALEHTHVQQQRAGEHLS